MKKVLFLLAAVALAAITISAQDLKTRAEQNPLDCAYYLLTKDSTKVSGSYQAKLLIDRGRFDEAIQVIDFAEHSDARFADFSAFAARLLKQGKKREAEKFIAKALESLAQQNWWSRELDGFLGVLIRSGRQDKVTEILSHRNEWDQTDQISSLLAVAEFYGEAGEAKRALTTVDQALDLKDSFTDPSQPLRIAAIYVSLGESERALALLAEINTEAISDPNGSVRDETMLDLIPLYFRLGQDDRARAAWAQIADPNDAENLVSFARHLAAAGKVDEARAMLRQAESNAEYLSGWGSVALVRAYLNLNDVDGAARVVKAKSTEEVSRDQQQTFMMLADQYIADGNSAAALKILDLARRKAGVLRIENDPMMAIYLSPLDIQLESMKEIVSRYSQLSRVDLAFESIHLVKSRAYQARSFRARALVTLAEEWVTRLPRKKILDLLAEAEKELHSGDGSPDLTFLDLAAIYAKIGERDKAVKLLVEVLNYEPAEDAVYRSMALQMAVPLVDEYKLASDPRVRKVLKQIVNVADK